MSQVVFTTTKKGRRIEVMGGWDRPLKHYHLMVSDLDAPLDENDILYTSLDDPDFERRQHFITEQIPHFTKVLLRMSLDAPPGFWDRFQRQEGNTIHTYRGDGNWSKD